MRLVRGVGVLGVFTCCSCSRACLIRMLVLSACSKCSHASRVLSSSSLLDDPLRFWNPNHAHAMVQLHLLAQKHIAHCICAVKGAIVGAAKAKDGAACTPFLGGTGFTDVEVGKFQQLTRTLDYPVGWVTGVACRANHLFVTKCSSLKWA